MGPKYTSAVFVHATLQAISGLAGLIGHVPGQIMLGFGLLNHGDSTVFYRVSQNFSGAAQVD